MARSKIFSTIQLWVSSSITSLFLIRVLLVPEGSIGANTLSGGKLCFESGLYLAAGVLCEPFVEQVFERHKIGQPFLCPRSPSTAMYRTRFPGQGTEIPDSSPSSHAPARNGTGLGDNAVYFPASTSSIMRWNSDARSLSHSSIVHIFPTT